MLRKYSHDKSEGHWLTRVEDIIAPKNFPPVLNIAGCSFVLYSHWACYMMTKQEEGGGGTD